MISGVGRDGDDGARVVGCLAQPDETGASAGGVGSEAQLRRLDRELYTGRGVAQQRRR